MPCCCFSRTGASSFRACFSFHSSYSEVLEQELCSCGSTQTVYSFFFTYISQIAFTENHFCFCVLQDASRFNLIYFFIYPRVQTCIDAHDVSVSFQIKDFLSYLKPVNIYPSVIPVGRTLMEVTQM